MGCSGQAASLQTSVGMDCLTVFHDKPEVEPKEVYEESNPEVAFCGQGVSATEVRILTLWSLTLCHAAA